MEAMKALREGRIHKNDAAPVPEPEKEPAAKKKTQMVGHLLVDGVARGDPRFPQFRVATFGPGFLEQYGEIEGVRAVPARATAALENAAELTGKWCIIERGECSPRR